jgi:hypothetical protein
MMFGFDVPIIKSEVFSRIPDHFRECGVVTPWIEANSGVEITLRDGYKLGHHTPDVRGTPANPMKRAEVDEKCFLLCMPIIGKRRARELTDAIWNIEKLRNVRALRQWLSA